MFRPEKIQKTTLFVEKEQKDALFHALHEAGVCEIASENSTQSAELIEAIELYQYTKRLHNRFTPYVAKFSPSQPQKRAKNFFKQITTELAKTDAQSQILLETIHDAQVKEQQLADLNATLQLLPPDVKTNAYEKSAFRNVEVGVMPTNEVADVKFGDAIYTTKVISDSHSLVIAFGEDDIAQTLFAHGFSRIEFERTAKTPAELQAVNEAAIAKCRDEIKTAKSKLTQIARDTLPHLAVYEEELDIYVRELTGLNQSVDFESFMSVTCWVTESQKKQFEKVVTSVSSSAIMTYQTQDDVAPTQLKNNVLAKPFELITKLYSVPKARGFDPTFFIAFTFPLFFGLMLTDFAYGLAMFLFATALFIKTPKRDEGVRGFSALLIISGISTMIFGVIFGSYFGNFFQDLGFAVPQLLDSMKDILPMIAIVLTIGILHISLGLIVGFVESIKQKEYVAAFKDQGVWLAFVLAIILLLASSLVGLPILNTVGFFTLAVSVMMQFIFTLRKDGGISAVLSLFDFSGFLGDVFSYIRLMALAIGTSGIALAVNFMVGMAIDLIPVVGIVFAILIFIVGHLFNLAMNGLGGFIHTLRLHFLEHFSKYYDGGGKEYTPYFANRNKTLVDKK